VSVALGWAASRDEDEVAMLDGLSGRVDRRAPRTWLPSVVEEIDADLVVGVAVSPEQSGPSVPNLFGLPSWASAT
jgi:hypothetical protein